MLAAGLAASTVWVFAEVGRRYSASGSHPRYIWASWERGLRYPALVYFVVSAAVEAAFYKDWLLFTTSTIGVALWISLWWEKKSKGDDDDYWTDLKKRLKHGFRSQAAAGSGA